jgi:hypothetical protein
MPDEEKLILPKVLAEDLHTTEGTLAQWRFHGKGPRFVKVGRNVRYRTGDVKAWLDAQTRERTGERTSA